MDSENQEDMQVLIIVMKYLYQTKKVNRNQKTNDSTNEL